MPKSHKNTPADRGRLAGKQKRYMDDKNGTYNKDLLRSDLDPGEYGSAYYKAYHKLAPVGKPPKLLNTSTTVYCRSDLLDQAKSLGINRSRVFESALEIAIKEKS
jgi:Post-segregation antitoxin CcdA